MLKITQSNSGHGTTIVLSGRLVGPWVGELLACWLRMKEAGGAVQHADLREVTFIDEAGKRLLGEMHRQGVTIQVSGCLMQALVQDVIGGGIVGRRPRASSAESESDDERTSLPLSI